jgi:hypothetical protein
MNESIKRYASTAVTVGLVGLGGTAYVASNAGSAYGGIPFSYAGGQYYVRDGSTRTMYPSKDACLRDVPVQMQAECEPASNYRSGSGYVGRYYGPVYHPNDTDNAGYRPSSQYPTEAANSSNIGKVLPKGSSAHGFGSTGKGFTGSKGS